MKDIFPWRGARTIVNVLMWPRWLEFEFNGDLPMLALSSIVVSDRWSLQFSLTSLIRADLT